jgi:DNA polymerase III epsilon subunit family exonuclease
MYAVIDVETTGFSSYDRIVEISIIVLDKHFTITQVFDSLVNPERDIPWSARRVHRIYDSEVQQAPRFFEILPQIVSCLRTTSYLIAHNAAFDSRFLNSELTKCGVILPEHITTICTLELARRHFRLQSHTLSAIAVHLQLPFDNPHLAFADTAVTTKLFQLLYQPTPTHTRNDISSTRDMASHPSTSPHLKRRITASEIQDVFRNLGLRFLKECTQQIEKSEMAKLPSDVQLTWYTFNEEQCSVEEYLTRKRKTSATKLYEHLSKAISKGRYVDISAIVNGETQHTLKNAWNALPSKKRTPNALATASGLALQPGVFKCVAALFKHEGSEPQTSTHPTTAPPEPSKARPTNDRARKRTCTLTDEQILVLDTFKTNESLKVHAFAGAGKTQTLVEIGHSTPRKGLYLSFNTKNAAEARRRFPSHVECSTTHALAYRQMKSRFSQNKLTDPLTAGLLKDALEIVDTTLHDHFWTAMDLATITLTILKSWMHTPSDVFDGVTLPPLRAIFSLSTEHQRALLDHCRALAALCWKRMISRTHSLPLSHDGYLKRWAMNRPVIESDYIMLDEGQDTNPLILDVLAQQACQLIVVGDRHQQIYEWRGAVDAMTQLPSKHECFLTRTFRFGDQIASYANTILRLLNESKTIDSHISHRQSESKRPHKAFLARTNATLMDQLASLQEERLRIHIQGGTEQIERLIIGIGNLQEGLTTNVPELVGFRSWGELEASVEIESRSEIAAVMRLVKRHSINELLGYLRDTVITPEQADVVLSTIHKAKGLEWDCVELSEDVLPHRMTKEWQKGDLGSDELRLLYVALTRARKDITLPTRLTHFLNVMQDDVAGRAAKVK